MTAITQWIAAGASAAASTSWRNRAVVRVRVLTLETHPEDLVVLKIYGDMGEHLTD